MVPSTTDPTVGHVRHFAAASFSLSQQLTFGSGICNRPTTVVNIVSEINNALSQNKNIFQQISSDSVLYGSLLH